MRQRSPKTFVKIRSGRKLFVVPNPVMSGKKCPRAECRDDEELLVKSDRPRMGEINARCQCAARSAVLSDFIARRGRAVGFHCAARSAALSDSIARREAPRFWISWRGAKRRAVGFHCAARSAALSNPLRGAKRRAVGFQRAARSAARSHRNLPSPTNSLSPPPGGGVVNTDRHNLSSIRNLL